MFCPNCGAQLPDGGRFCPSCGAEPAPAGAAAADTAARQESAPSPAQAPGGAGAALIQDPSLPEGIFRDGDGAYHWVYHLDMLRNPAMILTVFKVFFYVISGVALFMLAASLLAGNGLKDSLRMFFVMFFGINALFVVLGAIAWGIMILQRRGRYTIEHRMDEEAVAYIQTEEELERSERLGALTAAAGVLGGSPGAIGLGLTQASQSGAFISRYCDVKAVIARRALHLIKVNNVLQRNQIYAYPHQYDFVWSYIASRCPGAKIRG